MFARTIGIIALASLTLASHGGALGQALAQQLPYPGPYNVPLPPGPQPTLPQAELLPETMPLPAEVVPWDEAMGALAEDEAATWVLPAYWFSVVDWEGGMEVGINGTEGNAEALSLRIGGKLKRKTEIYELFADLTYLKATSQGIETQHNGLANFGYERFFGETPWTFFVKEMLEYDEFKAFDLRIAINTGIGYRFIKTDTTKLQGRLGAGFSHEIGGPDDEWTPEAVIGADYERQLTSRQKLVFKADYFPEWADFNSYRLVTDLSWEVLLDEAHDLNLKLSVNDRYDSTPNGDKPNDIYYGLLLLWKI